MTDDEIEAERKRGLEGVTFTVTCTMRRRWARQFLGMLLNMQRLGVAGSSRNTTLFADGDGDFRPKFSVASDGLDIVPAEPMKLASGDLFFDAG